MYVEARSSRLHRSEEEKTFEVSSKARSMVADMICGEEGGVRENSK